MQHFFGFDDEDFGKTFAVLIQFGAILALLSIYFARLWQLAIGLFTDPAARRFVIGVLIAFLPAAVVGALAHDFIKAVLFNAWIVCFTLIVGGARAAVGRPAQPQAALSRRARDSRCRCISCIGVVPVPRDDPRRVALRRDHRVGAMLLGADRRSAAEFSFWLAMPTMAGAFAYDLYKSHGQMSSAATAMLIAVGFVVSFVCAWIVVKTFLGYVQRHGFALFAWWRIIVGALGLIALALG